MPTYEFNCERCGDFVVMRPMSRRNEPCGCPVCGGAADRVILSTPALSTMSPQARAAYTTNERARHAPKSTDEWRAGRSHGPGCGCCGPGRSSKTTVTAPDGSKAFPTKRPWMISH